MLGNYSSTHSLYILRDKQKLCQYPTVASYLFLLKYGEGSNIFRQEVGTVIILNQFLIFPCPLYVN